MRQSFAWWSFTLGRDVDGPRFLAEAATTGVTGVEMLPPPLWDVARDTGLALVTATGHDIEVGFNDPASHAALRERVLREIDGAAAAGVEAVIVFAGNRGSLGDDEAIDSCA